MELTKREKIFLGVTGVVVTGVIVYFVFFSKDKNGAENDPTGNNGGNGQLPAFNPQSVAETLHNAMKDSGTDESAIFNVLQTVNAQQFVQVVNAFGLRKYNSFLGNDWGGTLQPLKVWLKEELNDSEYKTLRLKYPNSL